jgi:glycine/D-amino acid oxidase-like deaminating enzyme
VAQVHGGQFSEQWGEGVSETAECVVIGGGVVGSAIAYGLAKRGEKPMVLDGSDTSIRSSRVNFGLVWLHSKGDGMPAYGFWTRRSCDIWQRFADELKSETGVDPRFLQSGGLNYCLSEAEFETRSEMIQRMKAQAADDPYEARIIDRAQLQALMPRAKFGHEVMGASFGPHDGTCSPLFLLHALHAGLKRHGADYRAESAVTEVRPVGGRFEVHSARGVISTPKVVLAAGHGSMPLEKSLGFDVEIIAERGQIVVTERVAPMGILPANGVRQTAEGTVIIGSTTEDVGFDVSTTPKAGATMVRRALRVFPALAGVRMVRTWAGLRTLTRDECPVYEQSEQYPGAFIATCHSGVTLAAVHANDLADAIHRGQFTPMIDAFHGRRLK